jgi:P27 family predicted phage terminase small subunit
MARARRIAADLWKRLAPVLARSAGLTGEMSMVLSEYCVCAARIDQGERDLSRRGVLVKVSDRNEWVKNPWTTVLHQYRAHFRSLVGELGLSPAAATRITAAPDLDDPYDPFA